jgi:hypothetical protein
MKPFLLLAQVVVVGSNNKINMFIQKSVNELSIDDFNSLLER